MQLNWDKWLPIHVIIVNKLLTRSRTKCIATVEEYTFLSEDIC